MFDKNQLSMEELRSLTKIEDRYFYMKIGILICLLFFSFVLIASTSVILYFVGTIIAGLMYAHAVELQHQCLHYTAFKKTYLNKLWGVILGAPMFVSFAEYRKTHLKHHKNLGTREDEEFFTSRFKRYLKIFDFSKEWNLKSFAILILPILCIIFLYFNHVYLLKFWLIPVLTFGELFHYLIEFPEHYECNKNEKNPMNNTRTILGSKFSFWLTNGNNFHVEHHILAAVPINHLPKLHKLIKTDITQFNKNYFQFYYSILLKNMNT